VASALSLPARKIAKADPGRLARLFHALSDETRLAIVQKLLGGERCVCDLTDALDAAQPRLSFHLKVLKEAGLVSDRREGRWIHYSLVSSALAELESFCCCAKDAASESAGCCR
jgi:ArsR family transcriptional regulator, arsenate/arsenite/antimonite-responsive transcriptional repressor